MPVTSANAAKNPNPQGKGLVAALTDLALFNPDSVRRKAPLEFLRDYCVSSLVLAADFRFKPVVGKPYFLYSRAEHWLLSLVSPDEWGAAIPGPFVAACTLRSDMTWQVHFAELSDTTRVREKLYQFVDGFAETLQRQQNVADHLPFFIDHLPYYRRVLATGLATSLQRSSPAQPALAAVLEQRALPGQLLQ